MAVLPSGGGVGGIEAGGGEVKAKVCGEGGTATARQNGDEIKRRRCGVAP